MEGPTLFLQCAIRYNLHFQKLQQLAMIINSIETGSQPLTRMTCNLAGFDPGVTRIGKLWKAFRNYVNDMLQVSHMLTHN